MCQVVLVAVTMDLPDQNPVVVLREIDPPRREVSIPVGLAEGVAIAYGHRAVATPRPLTHEMLTVVLERFGVRLEAVRITSRVGRVYLAEMVMTSPSSGPQTIDCRPSDAIALAVRQELPVPLVVDEALFDD
jgi:bifunctional DNase/RNase